MKSVLISIQPYWVEKIASGKKTIEVRKSRPKLETPFKCYIYCTIGGDALAYPCMNHPKFDIHRANNGTLKGRLMTKKEREQSDYLYANGKVIGEFVCDSVYEWNYRQLQGLNGTINTYFPIFAEDLPKTCLTHNDLENYGNGKPLYGWHITNLKIYDKPRELSEFKAICSKVKHYETESKGFYKHCLNCEHLAETDSGLDYFECGKGKLTRPPQSWCYVESLGE